MTRGPLVVRTTSVPTFATYSSYKDYLRVDFWFACAYCSLAEAEARAVGFQIDHYDPRAVFRDAYENLYWACQPCNRFKSDLKPLTSIPFAEIIRIDHEDPDQHLQLEHRTV